MAADFVAAAKAAAWKVETPTLPEFVRPPSAGLAALLPQLVVVRREPVSDMLLYSSVATCRPKEESGGR